MTLQQLKYALTIAETGSMNKAAEQLYVSQPSLTASVQELEKETGILIFNRSGRGVTVTNDGAEFLQYAHQVVGQFDILTEKYSAKGNIKKKFGKHAILKGTNLLEGATTIERNSQIGGHKA